MKSLGVQPALTHFQAGIIIKNHQVNIVYGPYDFEKRFQR